MRRSLVPIFVIVLFAGSASAQWRKVADFIGTDGSLFTGSEPITCIYFLDLPGPPRIGFVGTESELLKTTNGGITWRSVWDSGRSFDRYYPNDICFRDSLVGWFSVFNQNESTGDACYRTVDGGEHWTQLNVPGSQGNWGAEGVFYAQSTNRLFLSMDTSIVISTDLGDTWNLSLPFITWTLKFWTPLRGIAAATLYPNYHVGVYIVTSDGGVTWDTINPTNTGSGEILVIPATSTCFMADYGHIIVRRSDDYGRMWKKVGEIPWYVDSFGTMIGPSGTGIIRGDLSHLYIQSDSGMYISLDEGRTWNKDGGPPYKVLFTNDRFYAGKGATFAGMTYNDGFIEGGGLWEEIWPQASVSKSSTVKNSLTIYPNPASTRIEISGASGGIRLCDLLGREVLRGELDARGACSLDVSALSPAVYVVMLEHDGALVPVSRVAVMRE